MEKDNAANVKAQIAPIVISSLSFIIVNSDSVSQSDLRESPTVCNLVLRYAGVNDVRVAGSDAFNGG